MKSKIFTLALISLCFFTQCSLDDDLPEDRSLTFEEQLALDIEIIDTYLENNEIEALIHENSSIRYTIDVEGEGDLPTISDWVEVKYEGRFLAGSIFNPYTEESVDFVVNDLIQAWKIMIPEMKVGSTYTIYAPSGYCYGQHGTFGIGPNQNLVFTVELISIK